MLDGGRLHVDGEDFLIQALVHALQHRVVFSLLVGYGIVFLDTTDALDGHILGNLNGIGAPGGNHFPAGADEETVQGFSFNDGSSAIEPTKFFYIFA